MKKLIVAGLLLLNASAFATNDYTCELDPKSKFYEKGDFLNLSFSKKSNALEMRIDTEIAGSSHLYTNSGMRVGGALADLTDDFMFMSKNPLAGYDCIPGAGIIYVSPELVDETKNGRFEYSCDGGRQIYRCEKN